MGLGARRALFLQTCPDDDCERCAALCLCRDVDSVRNDKQQAVLNALVIIEQITAPAF